MVRKCTNKLIEAIEDYNVVSWETVARECLARMSETEVENMCFETGFIDVDEDEDEDDI